MKTRLSILAMVLFYCSSPGFAEEKITFQTTEITSGLYVLQGKGGFAGGNIAISTGDDGVVMIDDSMPPLLDELKKAIAGISDKPVDFLINTHVHGDHTGNNSAMGEAGVHIIGHENIRKRLQMNKSDGETTPAKALPVLTFDGEITFHLNGLHARVFHLPHAHTDGDAAIHFPGPNVIHTGDILFNGMFPFIDLDKGGSVEGYIDDTIVIPGHGPVGKRADIKASYEMLIDAQARVASLKRKGKSEDEVVAANPLKIYHKDWNWLFITTEKMTRTLYRGLSM
ncbi:MAG: MBL fold metallo-hydrolase [Exilibacterium sp.]